MMVLTQMREKKGCTFFIKLMMLVLQQLNQKLNNNNKSEKSDWYKTEKS